MGEMAPEGQGTEEVTGTVAEETSGSLNPAWNDLLAVVPEQLHSQVTPHLQKWDQNYQKSLSEVHSQYAPYKDYLDNEIAPEQINYALQVIKAIETQPQTVMSALKEYAKANGISLEEAKEELSSEQGQVDETGIPEELLKHPAIMQMQNQLQVMAQYLVQQNEATQSQQEDAKLAKELEDLTQTHGDFDEEWVLTKAMNNPKMSLEDCVKAYKDFETSIIAKQRQPGPKVLGAGGMAPDNSADVKAMSPSERRSYMVKMLQAAAQQNQ